jgi:winged helix DNA-binding protein
VNDLIRRRLANQRLLRSSLRTPADVVSWLGAMQSQDYPGAKWAIGLRAAVTDEAVERAVNEGAIVRTHILRQTWHFVARDDIRWMLALSGPRVNAISAHYYRKMELDERTFTRSRRVFERVLRDGRALTRPELGAALHRAGITAGGTRLAFLTMRAELDAVICNGPRRGKQFTYALFDERVPPAPAIDREAALANLARRYFTSHGPATLKDYAWWSGLTVRDAKAGIDLAGSSLVCDEVGGFAFWSADGRRTTKSSTRSTSPCAHLLPNYDEYLIAHKDRHLVVSPGSGDGVVRIKDPFVHHVIVDGRLAGSWTRTAKNGSVHVNCAMYARPTAETVGAIDAAVARLGRFMESSATSSCSQLRSSKVSAGRR